MIRVFIVEKAPLTCVLMAATLKNEPGIEVVGFASSLDQSVLNQLTGCDVALINTTFSPQESLAHVQLLRSTLPGLKIVAIGMPESERSIQQYLEAGITSYISENEPIESWPNRIHQAINTQGQQAAVTLSF